MGKIRNSFGVAKQWCKDFFSDKSKYNWLELIVNYVLTICLGLLLIMEIICMIVYRDRLVLIAKGLIPITWMFPPKIMYVLATIGVILLISFSLKVVLMISRRRDRNKKGGPKDPVRKKLDDITKYKPIDYVDQDKHKSFNSVYVNLVYINKKNNW